MNSFLPTDSQRACEIILKEARDYNIENDIWPSENAVADRLLARGPELRDAYEDLYRKLRAHPAALRAFIGLLLNTVALWSPDRLTEARAARDELALVNKQIAKNATELAELLRHRADLHDTSGFASNTHYYVCDVIEAASQDNYRFTSYIRKPLDRLRSQFDLKYWPSLGDFLQVIASDADTARLQATDPLTAAGTAATRPSLSDFFKALFTAIEENGAERYNGQLPEGFRLSDEALASFANCALDLNPEQLVDGPYVKRLRQRERNRAVSTGDGWT